ncbi:MAG: four helix bundle protein [Bacteroidales bacterium]
MQLENLEIYQISMTLSQKIWEIVYSWPFFSKDTIGKQLVRAADSITANISEGYGRYYYKDAKNFLYYARGSLYETKSWITKSRDRKLIREDEFTEMDKQFKNLSVKLNNFIKSVGANNKPPV